MEVTASLSDPPIGAFIACNLAKVKVSWGKETKLKVSESFELNNSHAISRHLGRLNPGLNLYPSDILERTEVDHWLTLASGPLSCKGNVSDVLALLNQALAPTSYLTANHLTLSDIEVFGALFKSSTWRNIQNNESKVKNFPHIHRWFNSIQAEVKDIMTSLPQKARDSALTASVVKEKSPTTDGKRKKEEGGKFVDLPGAKMGEVVVRFPPEASGFLHIGHAKAALLNQYYQQAFKGKLIMRFDDTNPDKEKADFEKVIMEDVALLQIKPDIFSHSSSHFDLMIEKCEQLMKDGLAYADDTDAETMKKEREERQESKNRSNSLEQNMKMWTEMKAGTDFGQTCCIRAKIDMNSDNGCMRDPTIYRCKNEPHPSTGNKYKVYPTYDFACPIVDSIEGVTHALRTTEYHDRDDQFHWFIEKLNLRKVHIYEYSRLNMNNTVLSKRKLTWFVNEGLVDGWDDPRFPTVRGILRRGMTIEGLHEFIISQGSSRSVVNMEWDKIWSFNKKVIDRDSPRYTALQGDLVTVNVTGVRDEPKKVQVHPKDPSKGTKTIWTSSKVFIEAIDAEELKEGENATFINWGNIMIKNINRENDKISSVDAEPNLSNTDYKKTLKVTWLADTVNYPLTPVVSVFFDHIISKSVLSKDEDFKNFINKNTRSETKMTGDKDLRNLKEGDIIQLQRKGFFRVDKAAMTFSPSSCRESPLVLFFIPDGHTKETGQSTKADQMSKKEKLQSAKGKKAEKSPMEEKKNIVANVDVDAMQQIRNQEKKLKKLQDDIARETLLMEQLKSRLNNSGSASQKSVKVSGNKAAELNDKIVQQGIKVRNLKNSKANKATIQEEVNVLLSLKKEFKDETNQDWKPGMEDLVSTCTSNNATAGPASDLNNKVKAQGDKVRDLKANKADKGVIKTEVDLLLSLKKEFKDSTGLDWKPDIIFPKETIPNSNLASAKTGNEHDLNIKIKAQGDKVRVLKSNKADKAAIKVEVDTLLSLKKEFKDVTGLDWKPDMEIKSQSPQSGSNPVLDVHNKIKAQGDKVRDLKTNKADKAEIKAQVDILLGLKKEFKDAAGLDWKPDIDISSISVPAASQPVSSDANSNIVLEIHNKIKAQGDKVRDLKTNKADKAAIKIEVDVLLSLKKEFKNATGQDWKPDIDISSISVPTAPQPVSSCPNSSIVLEIHNKIKAQGDKVRDLKGNKADKVEIKSAVDILLNLKTEFKNATQLNWTPDIDISTINLTRSSPKPVEKKVSPPKTIQPKASSDAVDSKKSRLGIEFKKSEDFSEWYSQVITKSEMIEYYNVSGCYILRPWSFAIWDFIKDFFDGEIKKLGVRNAYFPIFVAKEALEKEKTHIADFSPEVAWVTKSGSSDLAEPIAIRPTSETVMYPAIAKWVQSHRDLPMKLNQWNNVVRWEFKQPTPFLRTREFLWQEGHSTFATQDEATEEVYCILELYKQIYEDLLAVPVVKGKKTEKEKFAGGDFTTTTEAFISSSGRAIQGATSHHLGQNFSKMFDITFEDPKVDEKKRFAYQNSWGFTTRSIGVMVMIHGDDKGLVLPPRVAEIQCIIMPVGITAKTKENDKIALYDGCKILRDQLRNGGVRADCDLRDNVTPAWKFNHWEVKGVPLRIEFGPRELSSGNVFVARRDNGNKESLPRESVAQDIKSLLNTIHQDMFNRAKADLDSHVFTVNSWNDFCKGLDDGNLLLSPYCGEEECEDMIKKDSTRVEAAEPGAPSMGAKSLCIPFEQPSTTLGNKCIYPTCKNQPKFFTLFGRSY